MFRTSTTIVVGAGASRDYGLPLGTGLREDISKLINIGYDDWGRHLETGDYQIVEALNSVARGRGEPNINKFISTCRQMAEAMPLALSIDNYLDAHQHDSDVLLCGKLAICRAILSSERASTLATDPHSNKGLDLNKLQNTWIAKLSNVLTEGVRKSELRNIFNNLTIISFNYDRCIKVFLRESLKVYYGLSDEEANNLVCSLKVYHPYGSVGALPLEGAGGVSFGSDQGGEALLNVSRGIKTFTEQIEDDDLVERIRKSIASSVNLIFVGFGFHRQNIELITPELPRACSRTFATTMGISPSDQEVIRRLIVGNFKPEHRNMEYDNLNGTSAELFSNYWLSITA